MGQTVADAAACTLVFLYNGCRRFLFAVGGSGQVIGVAAVACSAVGVGYVARMSCFGWGMVVLRGDGLWRSLNNPGWRGSVSSECITVQMGISNNSRGIVLTVPGAIVTK